MEKRLRGNRLMTRVLMLVLSCAFLLGSTITAQAADNQLYVGYKPSVTSETDYYWPLYVSDGGEKVAYCYNGAADWPAGKPKAGQEQTYIDNGWMFKKIANASAADMTRYAAGSSSAMKANVLKVVFNGFPYNAAGIKQTYSLTDMQLREVTQAAIWLYTDNTPLRGNAGAMTKLRKLDDPGKAKPEWPQAMVNAYIDMIGQGNARLVTPPKDFALDLYISELFGTTAPIQNLLAVRLDNAVVETMEIPVEKKWVGDTPADAEITVNLYANGDVFDSVKLNQANNWKHTFTDLPKQDLIKYTVDETDVAGYTKAITGSVTAGFTITNTQNGKSVNVSKVDIGGNEIAGAKLEIRDTQNVVKEQWESEAGKTHTASLQPGEYKLVETLAPNGYEVATTVRFTVASDGTVKVFDEEKNEFVAATEVKMVDEYSDQEVEISKVDVGGDEVEGAKLEIKDKNGNSAKKWESVANQNQKVKLQPGEYKLTETLAPNGYEKATDIRFTVDHTGTVKVYNEKTQAFENADVVKMVDEYSNQEVEISKVDIGGDEVEGAKLEIKDKNGTSVAKWESVANQNKKVSLQPGEYTLTETLAPNGYEKATDIRFTVDKDGAVKVYNEKTQAFENADVVKMVDEYSDQEVEISKVDIGGDEVEGAKLEIKDKNGNSVVKWESEADQNKKVSLQPGEYTLTETLAPNGYEKATDIRFTVDKTGTVKVYNEKTQAFENADVVKMVDEYSDQEVEISKVDIGGEEVAGAKLEITNKDGNSVAKWTSEADQNKKVSLQPGEYTLTETLAPTGYEKASNIRFSVDKDGAVKVYNEETQTFEDADKVEMVDEYSELDVMISKLDIHGAEIEGASLEITGQTSDGKDITPISWTSTKLTRHVMLKPGSYVLHEEVAPDGYEYAVDIPFTVALGQDGKVIVTVDNKNVNGKVSMIDKYSDHEIGISKVNLDGKEIEGAKIVVKNSAGEVVDKWTSEKGKTHKLSVQPGVYTFHEEAAPKGYKAVTDIKFSVDVSGRVSVLDKNGNTVKVDTQTGHLVVTDQYDEKSKKSVKTGDDMNILLAFVLMITSLMGVCGTMVYRRD